MTLASAFLAAVGKEKFESFVSVPDLETELLRLEQSGSSAWPEIHLDSAIFIVFLARTLPSSAALHLRNLRAGDLWLACAYGMGVRGAARVIETHIFPPVETALSRLGISAAMMDDIGQNLRRRLVEMQQPTPTNQGYSGRGDLAGWLYVCAVREANRRNEVERRELSLEDQDADLLPSSAEDPEMAYIRNTYKKELQQSFREALASLTSKERNLLRYYFLDGMTVEKIGALHGVHHATAARWVNRARDNLRTRTRAIACKRISLSEEGFERILGLIESQIHANLAMEPG